MTTSGHMPLCMACLCVLLDNGRFPASAIQSPVAHAVWPDKAEGICYTHQHTVQVHTHIHTCTGKARQDFIFAYSLSHWKNDYDSSYVASVCVS